MIYIPLKYLKPGMVLAHDTPSNSFFSLLTAGQQLTEQSINRLIRRGIKGVYIESSFCDGATAEEFIDPEFKNEVLFEIKKVCSNYVSQSLKSTEVYRSFSKTATKLVSFILSKDEFLVNIVDIRDYDNYTYSHSMYVSILSVLIGLRMGLKESVLNDLAMCGLLHDIGKLDLPVAIVNKPGRLTPDEFAQMRKHPENAVQRLKPNRLFSAVVLNGVESHHERYDGTGYPNGLSGERIPLYGRILSLADVYDALTSSRPYRNAWSSKETIEYMTGCAGTHFDCELLRVFLNTIAIYPVGNIVKLSNGYFAVVTGNTPGQTLRPKVRVMLPKEQQDLEIDLAADAEYYNVTVVGTLDDDDVALPAELFQ